MKFIGEHVTPRAAEGSKIGEATQVEVVMNSLNKLSL